MEPNTNLPVQSIDPNKVPDAVLPTHVHKSEQMAVRDCGLYCEMAVTEGGARRLAEKLGRQLVTAPTSGSVPNLVINFKFSDHASRTVPSIEDIDILMNSEIAVPGVAPTAGVKKVFLDNS